MKRYSTSYRLFILTKAGLGAAYLWLCWDFLRIDLALQGGLRELIPGLYHERICGNELANSILIHLLAFLSTPAAIWIYCIFAPLVVGCYVWGRFRWLQVGVGVWAWISMIGLTARASIVMTTADFWLSWCFILYAVSGLVTPRGKWEESQPYLSREGWREGRIIHSEYAWLMVILQFTVYFYAGVNKLVYGWTAWTSGVALQNLFYDPAMHSYLRGMHLPYLVSLILCYATLFQRLIVPFGFFSTRYRNWTVLILGTMHIGYELVMKVAIFPLVGIACLLLIIYPEKSAEAVPSKAARKILAIAVVGLLLIEPAVMSYYSDDPPYWNVKLATQLHWIMFADGGSQSKERFRIAIMVHDPSTGDVHYDEVTDLPFSYFPYTWRTRLYEQAILRKAIQAQRPGASYVGTDSYLEDYIHAAVRLYKIQTGRPRIEQFVLSIDPYDKKSFSP
jgi:hypothetical protein